MTYGSRAAFDAARRRYNAAHGIPDTGPRCTSTFAFGPGYRCQDIPGHTGMHHAHDGLTVVSWSDDLAAFIRSVTGAD